MTANRQQAAIFGIRFKRPAYAHRVWLRCATLGLVLLALPRLAALADEKPAADDGLLTASGRVLLPDGSPAAGAVVQAASGGRSEGIPVVHANQQGEFRLRDTFDTSSAIHARTADGRLVASLYVAPGQARTMFARPVELHLSPGREQVVSVTFQNKPLAGATVAASDTSNFQATAETDGHGQVRLYLPAGQKLQSVVAWHPSCGAGGKMFGAEDEEPSAGGPLALNIVPARPYSVRAVDGQGRPVPNLELAIACNAGGWILTANVDAAHVRTDARGEALVPWMPRDPKYVNVNVVAPHWKRERSDAQQGKTVVTVLRTYPVSGRLVLPPGVDGKNILVAGSGTGPLVGSGRSYVDAPTTRARADGRFTFWVVPGNHYSVNVLDAEWASEGWGGLILAGATATPAEIRLSVEPAVKLSVRVTRGPEHRPVPDTWVTLRSSKTFSWKDSQGRSHRVGGGPHSGVLTDANGTARFGVRKGQYELFMISGKWIEQRKIDVRSDQPLTVAIDRPWIGKRIITGRLIRNGKPHPRGPATVVRAWSQKRPWIDGKGVVEADGRFSVGIDADDAYLFAFDSRERLSMAASVGPAQSAVDLDLLPMGSVSGVVVDEKGKPIAGRAVELLFKGPGFMDLVAIDSTLCDEKGRFHFDAVPSQQPVGLCSGAPVTARSAPLTLRPNEFQIDANDELYLDLQEHRTNMRLAVDPRLLGRETPTPAVPLAARLTRLTRDVRLAGMRLLLVLQGDSSPGVDRLSTRVVDDDELPDVLRYLTLTVGPEDLNREARLFERVGCVRPKPREIALVVLGGGGEKLAETRIDAGDDARARKQAAQFVTQHVPPRRDARAALAAAQDEARDTGRRVVIVEGGPRCGPCMQLARWMDDQHALLAKDYVIVKVLSGIDDHAKDIIAKLNPPRGAGIPWFAVTEPDGTVLATSDGPLGNTGFPVRTEEKKHFKKMLDRTARHLTPAERERLLESLPNE